MLRRSSHLEATGSEHEPPTTQEPPARGRRLFGRQQTNRQGTPGQSGRAEPRPRVLEGPPYRPEPGPEARGASRGKRIAWSLGALTAVGGLGGYWYARRRRRSRGRDRSAMHRR